MKVIIYGAKGMLGQELAEVFDGYNPILFDRTNLDVTDNDQVRESIKKASVKKGDVVLNASAYNDVDGAETNGDLAMAVNGAAPGYLAEAINAVGGILVHYSTDYVFDGKKKDGYTEDDAPNPLSEYGKSKLEGEKAVHNVGGQHYIIRLSRLYGKPATSRSGKKSFVDLMLDLANKPELKVINEEFSSPTYVRHLAERTLFIIRNVKKYNTGIYHVSNEGACTWYGFAKKIFDIKNEHVKIIKVKGDEFKRAAQRPQYSELISKKLPKMASWEDALKEYLENK